MNRECLRIRAAAMSPHLLQQTEVVVAGESGGLEVAPDDEHRNLGVSRDHHWAEDTVTNVRPVTPLLARETKPDGEEDAFERTPVDGCESGHALGSGRDGGGGMLNANPGWASPVCAVGSIAGIFEDFGQSTMVFGCSEEQADGLLQCRARSGGRWAGAGDVQRHGVSDILIAFTPRLNREFDLHASSLPIEAVVRNYRFAVHHEDFQSVSEPLVGESALTALTALTDPLASPPKGASRRRHGTDSFSGPEWQAASVGGAGW
jgi:hypothetical protein